MPRHSQIKPDHESQNRELKRFRHGSPDLNVAVSGINFAVLCIVSMVLIRLAVPPDPTEPGTWLADPTNRRGVYFALHLVPFMGLAFLWFMAVLRHRIGTDAGRLSPRSFSAAACCLSGRSSRRQPLRVR